MPPLRPNTDTSRRSLAQTVEQSTVILMVCIGSLILLLAILILFHENANATKGYQLRSLERERMQLLLEREILHMKVAQDQAIDTLQSDSVIQAMRPVRDALYVQGERAVAYE